MRNVLHLIDTFETGGAETVFAQLVGGLDPSRFRSIPAVLGRGWLQRTMVERGHTPLELRTTGSFDLRFLRQLLATVREQRIDLIQTHLLTSAVYASIVGRLTRVPVVSTFHGVADVNSSRLGVKSALVNGGVDRIVFVSDTLRRQILASTRFAADRATVIHNGVDLDRFRMPQDRAWRRSLGVKDHEILIGGVGRASKLKNFPSLLRALAALRAADPRFALVIVGAEDPDGDRSEHDDLVRLRSELGLGEAVRFVGFQSDMPAVMQSLDVLAVTSLTEGFSLTSIEAMACGVPVVATRCGGPEEILSDERDGLLISVSDDHALVVALRRVASDPELRGRLAVAGRATVERRFSLAHTLTRYAELYDSLLGARIERTTGVSDRPQSAPTQLGAIRTVKRSAQAMLTSRAATLVWSPFLRSAATILMLHRFADPEFGVDGHDPKLLAQNLEQLRRDRFVVSSLGDLLRRFAAGEPPLPRTVVFTVDDGYADFPHVGAPIFERYDCPVTAFLITGFVDGERWLWYDEVEYLFGEEPVGALSLTLGEVTTRVTWATPAERRDRLAQLLAYLKRAPTDQVEQAVRDLAASQGVDSSRPSRRFSSMSWDEVRRCEDRGASFGPHTHRHPILSRASTDRARIEIEHAWQRLRTEVRAPVPVFCYPNGMSTDFTTRERDLVRAAGLEAAVAAQGGHCGLQQFRADRFALPRLAYQEDPLEFRRAVGGLERLNLAIRRAVGR